MASALSYARALAAVPVGLLRAPMTKLSIGIAAYIGLATGAWTRAAGTEPAPVIAEVREGMFTPNGRLASRDVPPPTPMHRWAEQQFGAWVTEPVLPAAWNTAIEQTVAVPMIRSLLGLMEATAGIGHWLAGFVPPQVIGYGGVVVFGVFTLLHLRTVVLRTAEVAE
jgi:hypothetical protein